MRDAPFRLAPLEPAHDRVAFRSDSEPLNRYLREQVTQDIRRRVAACFVASRVRHQPRQALVFVEAG